MNIKISALSKHSGLILAIGILLYTLSFLALTFWKLSHFYYDNLDLAIFNNVFFNTLHGVPFGATIHPPTYLGDHFSPIIFTLLPLYALAPGQLILLVIETVTISLTAIPLYLIAREMLGHEKKLLAVGIAFLWLANPSVHNMNFFEFELLPLAVFFLFWAFYFYLKQRRGAFIIFILLALLVREDAALIVLMFGPLAWIDTRSSWWKWTPLAVGILYAAASFVLISYFAPSGAYKFLAYYGWLGGTTAPTILWSFATHPIQLILHQLTMRNLEFILAMSFPFFFLVLARTKYLLLLVPPLAQIWLSAQGGSVITFSTHYAGYFLFGLFIIFIAQVQKIETGRWPRLIPKILHTRYLLYFIIGGASVYAALTYGSIVPALAAWNTNHQQDEKKTLINKVPFGAPVAATFELLSPLSTRQNIYALHYALVGKNQFASSDYALPADTEYLAIDWQDMVKTQMHFHEHHAFGSYANDVPQNLTTLLRSFHLQYASGSITLWQKNTSNEISAPFVDETKRTTDTGSTEPQMETVQKNDDFYDLEIQLPITSSATNYYLSVTTPKRQFMLPLGYGMSAPTEWQSVSTLRMPVFLDTDETTATIQLYRWGKSFLTLGKLKNLTIVNDAKTVGDPLTISPETR